MTNQGYRHEMKTFFVWEAVTQYLTETAVRETFAFLARAAPGSRLVFTFVQQDFMDGTNFYGAESLYQRFRVRQPLWHFGMKPEEVSGFLAEHGWQEVEQMGAQAFEDRYTRPLGREMAISDLEHSVYAQKA